MEISYKTNLNYPSTKSVDEKEYYFIMKDFTIENFKPTGGKKLKEFVIKDYENIFFLNKR